jgi:hypothetical protein
MTWRRSDPYSSFPFHCFSQAFVSDPSVNRSRIEHRRSGGRGHLAEEGLEVIAVADRVKVGLDF